MMLFLETFAKVLLFCCGLLFFATYLTFIERKTLAAMQLRKGPNKTGLWGLLQPIADGIKLLNKEIIVLERADKGLFCLAAFVAILGCTSPWLVIPFSKNSVFSDLNIGVLYLLIVMSLSVYAIILAGLSSNSSYSMLGATRAMAQFISYKIAAGFIILSLALKASSFSLSQIVLAQKDGCFFLKLFPLGIIFFLCSLAETNRSPFDIWEAESELVTGYAVEYSSILFGLFYLSEYCNIILFSAVNAIFFFGGWLPICGFLAWLPSPLTLFIKTCLILFLFIWIRATFPRLRFDQFMMLGWKFFIPVSFIGFVIVALWQTLVAALAPSPIL